jgi:hypothetical protein
MKTISIEVKKVLIAKLEQIEEESTSDLLYTKLSIG